MRVCRIYLSDRSRRSPARKCLFGNYLSQINICPELVSSSPSREYAVVRCLLVDKMRCFRIGGYAYRYRWRVSRPLMWIRMTDMMVNVCVPKMFGRKSVQGCSYSTDTYGKVSHTKYEVSGRFCVDRHQSCVSTLLLWRPAGTAPLHEAFGARTRRRSPQRFRRVPIT